MQELNADFKKLKDDRQSDRESFQKTIQALQKSLQENANVLKEKEESNSILRKEAMDLVARYFKVLIVKTNLGNHLTLTLKRHRIFLNLST